jgi:uncharacterized OB-fold protein
VRHAYDIVGLAQPVVVSGPVSRIVPALDDDNSEFWTSGAVGELRLPYCAPCGHFVFPPSKTCRDCGGSAVYTPLSGRGHVFTYTVNHHRYHPEVPVPYVIAIVELVEQEGLRFTTDIVHCPVESVVVGLPVRVVFEQQGEVYIPLFEPDAEVR